MPENNERNIIFFDGVCNLCNGLVNFVVSMDSNRRFHIASLQGQTAKELLSPEEIHKPSTLILIFEGKKFERSRAVIEIFSHLKWYLAPTKIFLILPSGLRDLLYHLIARNRYRLFGQRKTCRIPQSNEKDFFLK